MTLQQFKDLPEKTVVMVNGRPYEIYTSVGHQNNDMYTIRLCPLDQPIKVRYTQEHDEYLAGKNIQKFLNENKVRPFGKIVQGKLF